MHPVILPPPLGVHNGHVPGSQGAPRGSGAPHGPPRRSTTLTQTEPVRAPAFGGALRGAKSRPITPDTLGARVVAVLGTLVVAGGAQGGVAQRTYFAIDPMCTP